MVCVVPFDRVMVKGCWLVGVLGLVEFEWGEEGNWRAAPAGGWRRRHSLMMDSVMGIDSWLYKTDST